MFTYWDEMVCGLVDMYHTKWHITEDHTFNSQP